MFVLPAIDLIDGACVRLTRGDYATSSKVADDPEETASRFRAAGARWLHMVDLDGAAAGVPKNRDVIVRIAETSGLDVEVGGGIREESAIEDYLAHGVKRVILGSVALKNPDLVARAVRAYGDAVAVGIDAMDGMARAEGWLEASEIGFLELAERMSDVGVATIVYTDIARDGTLGGPNLAQLRTVNEAVPARIIASGGIRNLSDIKALAALNLYGAICGKSVYTGSLDLSEAISAAERDCGRTASP
ncbi:MAG: 1-(5-phosphoribosyl)-5-[(5-phosphoribosylamino)methylideneamino]imidazole-4-carboxamide isomerase [Clostridiales Family XIII bacterium]|jgi:phosphoribosylformimino-5-aminoimidazole carboxamide ribotide isomerase|nr:1-(5-phosphoribosyl)-5-[(5-phosphoribosylamino)methylideneamino]imidazole-4-carboxamide isomerase [Clostridiales Family XIII bacterium]